MKVLSRLATQKEFAAILGCKPSYVVELKRTGRLVLEDKLILVQESLDRIRATRDPSKAATALRHAQNRGVALTATAAPENAPETPESGLPAGTPGQPSYDYQASKAKREHWAAEREHALWRKEAGELMERAVVVSAFSHAGALIRSKLESWSETLPGQLVGQTEAQIQTTIADQVERLLRDLSDGFAKHGGADHE